MITLPSKFCRAGSAVLTSVIEERSTEYGGNYQGEKINNGQRFQLDMTIDNLTHINKVEFSTMLMPLGRTEAFKMESPLLYRGYDRNFSCLAYTTRGQTEIPVQGLTNSKVKALHFGDLVTFDNHEKAYMITENVTASATGTGLMKVFPPLFEDVPTNISIRKAVMTVRKLTSNFDLDLDKKKLHIPQKLTVREV